MRACCLMPLFVLAVSLLKGAARHYLIIGVLNKSFNDFRNNFIYVVRGDVQLFVIALGIYSKPFIVQVVQQGENPGAAPYLKEPLFFSV